jgi:sensor domain CHASE-containing protein
LNLRYKTLITISITVISLILVLYIISQTILVGSFLDLEDSNTIQNTALSQDAFFYELSDLETLTTDWATMNTTASFIQDSNKEYIASNLADRVFVNSNINLVLFTNPPNQVVFGKGFDLEITRK